LPGFFGSAPGSDGDQGATRAEAFIEVTGVFFRYTHAHECPEKSSRRRTNACSGQGRCQSATRDDRTYTRNCQGPYSGQQANDASQDSPAHRAGSCSFRGLSTSVLDQLLLAAAVAHGDPDLILGKSSLLEPIDRSLCVDLVPE
jgi:hypothetical protein